MAIFYNKKMQTSIVRVVDIFNLKKKQMYIFSTDKSKLLSLNKFRKESASKLLLAFLYCKTRQQIFKEI